MLKISSKTAAAEKRRDINAYTYGIHMCLNNTIVGMAQYDTKDAPATQCAYIPCVVSPCSGRATRICYLRIFGTTFKIKFGL
jgi:hypothetical protein